MAPVTFFILLLLSYILPAACTSTVEFYSDGKCTKSVGKVNGTLDGVCHPAVAGDASVKLTSIDPHCAATIYSDPYCSNDATIANLGNCESGSLIVGSFSIDCKTDNTSKAFTVAVATSTTTGAAAATSTPSSVMQTHTASASASTTSQTVTPNPSYVPTVGLIVAIAVASTAVVALLPVLYFWRRSVVRRRRAGGSPKAYRSTYPTELAGEEKAELAGYHAGTRPTSRWANIPVEVAADEKPCHLIDSDPRGHRDYYGDIKLHHDTRSSAHFYNEEKKKGYGPDARYPRSQQSPSSTYSSFPSSPQPPEYAYYTHSKALPPIPTHQRNARAELEAVVIRDSKASGGWI